MSTEFASADLTAGQLNAIVKKLGAHLNVVEMQHGHDAFGQMLNAHRALCAIVFKDDDLPFLVIAFDRNEVFERGRLAFGHVQLCRLIFVTGVYFIEFSNQARPHESAAQTVGLNLHRFGRAFHNSWIHIHQLAPRLRSNLNLASRLKHIHGQKCVRHTFTHREQAVVAQT